MSIAINHDSNCVEPIEQTDSQADTALASDTWSGRWEASFSLPSVTGLAIMLVCHTMSEWEGSKTKFSRSVATATSENTTGHY